MAYYKNFKSVTYCVAQWADRISEDQLRKETEWMQKYIGIDKVYLETFRGSFARKEQILMIKKVLAEYGIEVSGGITTVVPDLDESDSKRQRLFETFCYSNEKMRQKLIEVSEYTASLFDEFIIDDFFFTQCTCEDCVREKKNKSWSQFRLEKMMDVSENLILKPAKKINPNCKVIIKYPNWRESYHETGYNPGKQRNIFDSIYTGTETRHGAQQDQHLPRYLSYSLPRYMENVAPGRNGGGWFDPFECDRIDSYLEQAYLTAFSKSKEIMMFCWPALYNNKRATPLGFQYERLDRLMGQCGNPVGLKVYVPFDSCGDDHIEDFLGMIGVPMEPTPDFPDYDEKNTSVMVTASSLFDENLIPKMTDFIGKGGKVIATGNFVIQAQKNPKTAKLLSELTSIKYTDRRLDADEFQVTVAGLFGRNYVKTGEKISFPILEHRNNATWSILNAGHGEYHESVIMYDTYGKGMLEVINLPDMPSKIRDLPSEVLTAIRYELLGTGKVWIDAEYGVSLFTYDNDTFGLYCYTNDNCKPLDFQIHVKTAIPEGEGNPMELADKIPDISLKILRDDESAGKESEEVDVPWRPKKIKALYKKPLGWKSKEGEVVFHTRMIPGDWQFFRIDSE